MDIIYKLKLPVPENTNKFINRNRRNPYLANNAKKKLKQQIKKIVGEKKIIKTPFLLFFDIHTKITLNSDIDNITFTKDLIDSLISLVITDDSLEYMPLAPIVTVSQVHLNQYNYKNTENIEPYTDLFIYDLSNFNFKSYYHNDIENKIINGKQGKEIKIHNDNIRKNFVKTLKNILDEI